jgi:hypothetical protein
MGVRGKVRVTKTRGAVLVAGGIATVLSLGLGADGAATAATPDLHIKNASKWVVQGKNVGCEVVIFSSSGSFVESGGSATGVWSGGGENLVMKWTARGATGLVYRGTWRSSAKKYAGKFSGNAKGRGDVTPGSVC